MTSPDRAGRRWSGPLRLSDVRGQGRRVIGAAFPGGLKVADKPRSLGVEVPSSQLRKEADAFPKRLAQEIDRAVAEARRQGEQQFEQRILVATKDAEADKRVAELRIKTLEETAARQAEQAATLQKQLDEAKRQVQDIAVKAIEGASGAQALARVNSIAMEQARTRPTQG